MYQTNLIYKRRIRNGLILIIIFNSLFLSWAFGNSLDKDAQFTYDTNELKISGLYNDIMIDDSPGSINNWLWARTQAWCTQGSGSLGDPYIIEDQIFEYSSAISGDSFRILNSRKYFIINNCMNDNFSLTRK